MLFALLFLGPLPDISSGSPGARGYSTKSTPGQPRQSPLGISGSILEAKNMYSRNGPVTKKFRTEVLRLFPQLAEKTRLNRQWFGFFELLCFNTFTDEHGRGKVISHAMILAAVGLRPGTKFGSGAFLDSFVHNILPGLVLWENGAYEVSQKCRAVVHPGFPDAMKQLLDDELRRSASSEMVALLTGEPWKPSRSRALAEEERCDAGAASAAAPCDATRQVIDYMNCVSHRLFESKVRENIARTLLAAERLPEAIRTEQLALLRRIAIQPQPFYVPKKRTVRLFSSNESILRLKNVLKYSLTVGWRTFDLRAAQLAILAREWGLDAVRERLAAPGDDVWSELCDLFPMLPPSDLKPVVKQAVYSVCYGRTRDRVRAELGRTLGLERDEIEPFMQHPIVSEVVTHCEATLSVLLDQGGVRDCFGRELRCGRRGSESARTREEARSVLAQHSQALELKLLLPAIRYARDHATEVSIVLWEHDGFSVHCMRRDVHVRRIVDAVNAECDRLGVPTRLVEKGT